MRRESGLVPAALAATFVVLCAWSWGKWADAQIDFGYELYLPWQLLEGRVLYRDLAYRNGPLSPYLNSLWLGLWGVSIRTLVLCNLAILAGVCLLAYRLLRPAAGRFAAGFACGVFLCVFAFGQHVSIGNYNFVTPYQHAQTHGLLLSLCMLSGWVAAVNRGSRVASGLAGVCLGAVFLTKAELFAPALATAGFGLVLVAMLPAGATPRSWLVASFAGGALLPPVLALLGLAMAMPLETAWQGVLGNWLHLGGEVAADPFYRKGMGIDRPGPNLLASLAMFGAVALFCVLLEILDRRAPASGQQRSVSLLVGVVVFGLLASGALRLPFVELPRALPIFALVVGVAAFARLMRHPDDREQAERLVPLALWSVYGLALLFKMLLNARVYHYGFVLAMPATLLLVVVLVRGRAIFDPDPRRGWLAPSLAVAVLAAGVTFYLEDAERYYARRTLAIGEEGDRLLFEAAETDPKPAEIARLLDRLAARMPAAASLLVLPEGSGINYWLRRPNPSRYSLFLPTEFDAVGGDTVMLEDLRSHPPDFVVVLPRDQREFGRGPFGTRPGNGANIRRWLEEAYVPLAAEEWQGRAEWPVAVLRRKQAH